MKYKTRLYSERLLRLTGQFSVVVLSGARQVGRSTLLEHLLPNWDRVVFDPVIDVGNARSDPELFLSNHPVPLILDEIQYCPELVPSIKRKVDGGDKRPGMYVLTGSQQWSVIRSISESLAGRAVFIDLEGFALSEIAGFIPPSCWLETYLDDPVAFVAGDHQRVPQQRTLYEQLWRGWLPEMDTLPPDVTEDFFAAYVRTYVERDVRLTLDVGDAQQFGRFTQLAAALSAQEINYSQLGREIGITPQTAKRWLAVLKATFQWYEFPAYHGNTIKKISSKPKGYFADTGLACHLHRFSSPKALSGHPMLGAIYETAVAAEIRKLMGRLMQKAQVYHWRAHSGSEVDILLERDGMLYPIEIKLSSRPSRKDARGLRSLREHYPNQPVAPGLIVAPVDRVEAITEDDYVIPWDLA